MSLHIQIIAGKVYRGIYPYLSPYLQCGASSVLIDIMFQTIKKVLF
jgi:hypothetical protein